MTDDNDRPTGASYAAAGVDIEAGDRAVELFAPLEREEDVIQSQTGYIIRWITVFSARAVEHGEIGAGSEQDIPRVEIPVNLPQTMR